MREFLTLPNAITTGNLTCGFLALSLLPTRPVVSAALVVAAAIFDSVDGPIARRRGKDQTFGMTLDSLADLVSFGVTPAMAVFLAVAPVSRVLAMPVALFFVICGAWRLARYPLVKSLGHFVGLPIPVAGITVMLLIAGDVAAPVLVPLVLALSGLMVSSLPCPTVGRAPEAARALARRMAGRS